MSRFVRTVALAVVCAAGVVPLAAPAEAAASSCVLVAHRGYHATATENGMPAFRQAVRDGADFIELDVRVTADGSLMLMHDPTVNRTTDGRGYVVKKSTKAMRALRLDDGSRVPFLKRALALAQDADVRAMVELKAMGAKDTYRRLAGLIRAYGRDRVVVTSFDRALLRRFHRFAPGVARAPIETVARSAGELAGYPDVAVRYDVVTDAWLDQMRSAGIGVYVWIVNDPAAWSSFSGKVAGVVTDDTPGYDTYRSTEPACQ